MQDARDQATSCSIPTRLFDPSKIFPLPRMLVGFGKKSVAASEPDNARPISGEIFCWTGGAGSGLTVAAGLSERRSKGFRTLSYAQDARP